MIEYTIECKDEEKMLIKSLRLKNYRSFEEFNIDFDDNLTVIVAENGVGKSSVLDAVSVALGQFVGGFDAGRDSGFVPDDARLAITNSDSTTHMIEMESQYPIELFAKGQVDGIDEEWSRDLTGNKARTTYGKASVLNQYAKKLQDEVRKELRVSLPIISYYGTGRLWNQKQKVKESSEHHSRLFGYDRALEPASTYKEFAKWFEDESKAEYDKIVEMVQRGESINSNLIEASAGLQNIREAVNICLKVSGWENIRYNSKFKKIIATHSTQGVIPVERLSDGVRSMLAMTADIAYRCTKLNPHLNNAPKETKGIVQIDEIEMHLHPKWQQEVIPNLQKAFPLIQFIITTHSPQVLSGIKNEAIRIISNAKVYSAPLGTEGAEASRILKRVFEVDLRPKNNSISIKLNKYLDLVYDEKWGSTEAMRLRKELDIIFHGEEPVLIEADLYIENRKWELEIEEGT